MTDAEKLARLESFVMKWGRILDKVCEYTNEDSTGMALTEILEDLEDNFSHLYMPELVLAAHEALNAAFAAAAASNPADASSAHLLRLTTGLSEASKLALAAAGDCDINPVYAEELVHRAREANQAIRLLQMHARRGGGQSGPTDSELN